MNSSHHGLSWFLWLLFLTLPGLAVQMTGSFDSGGGVSTSENFRVAASLGPVGGNSSNGSVSNNGGGPVTQPSVKTLTVTASPASVSECSTSQLSGVATMDDATVAMLTGADLNWDAPSSPIVSINSNGMATVAAVYQNTAGNFSGWYLGAVGSNSLLVQDTLPDNYGIYDSDGIADSWQIQFFGLDNPNAAPSVDVTGTGQNNLFKYVAGLDPTNAASVFRLRVESVVGQSNQKRLIFTPRWDERTYTPMFRTNLVSGTWITLTDTNVTDNGTERTLIDTNATGNTRFYRIQINSP